MKISEETLQANQIWLEIFESDEGLRQEIVMSKMMYMDSKSQFAEWLKSFAGKVNNLKADKDRQNDLIQNVDWLLLADHWS